MPRRQRVLLMVHPWFRPDQGKDRGSRTERDVWVALKRLGLECRVAAVRDGLGHLEREVDEFKPDAVFNLLEEFRDEAIFDFHPITWLESKGIPYTGCNPRALILTRNKLWVSRIAAGSGVRVPDTWNASDLSKPQFPMLVKYCNEHASLGLTRKNIVHDQKGLSAVLKSMRRKFDGQIIGQQFVAGREISVSVMGHRRIEVFAPREVLLHGENAIITERIKFSAKLRHRTHIRARHLPGPPALLKSLMEQAKRLFQELSMNGYARFDFRLRKDGQFFLIDANANPNLERTEDLALSARQAGYSYEELLLEIIRLAKSYQPIF